MISQNKFKTNLLCLLFIFLCSSISFSQNNLTKERQNDAFLELDKNMIKLRFIDALLGTPIKGASVKIESEFLITDIEGSVSIPKPENDSTVKVLFECKNYITTDFSLNFPAGTLLSNRFSISPILPEGSIRIVLDWGIEPKDLDANLIKNGDYHISYRNLKESSDKNAHLEINSSEGYGPETISIKKVEPFSEYIFFVHDFTDKHDQESIGLSSSNAVVKLYSNNKLLHVVPVPKNIAGNYWDVFRIKEGGISLVNEIKKGIE